MVTASNFFFKKDVAFVAEEAKCDRSLFADRCRYFGFWRMRLSRRGSKKALQRKRERQQNRVACVISFCVTSSSFPLSLHGRVKTEAAEAIFTSRRRRWSKGGIHQYDMIGKLFSSTVTTAQLKIVEYLVKTGTQVVFLDWRFSEHHLLPFSFRPSVGFGNKSGGRS